MAFHYIISGRSFLLLTFITCLCGYRVIAQNDSTIEELQKITVTETTIVVQWKAPSSFTNFKVSYTNSSATNEMNVTDNNCTITNLLPGVIYNITVHSVNETYTSSGTTISVTTLPSIVTGLGISNVSPHEVTVSWTTSSDRNENTYTYIVEVQGPNFVNQTSVKAKGAVVQNLQPGSDYNFTVYAVTNNNVSSRASNVTNVTTLPSIVTDLVISNISTHEVTVSWKTSSDPNKNTYTYIVEVQGPNFVNRTSVNANSTVVQNLQPGSDYNFTVYAVTNNNVSSRASNVTNVTTLPSIVTDLVISNISTDEVTVSWTTSSDPNENTYTYIVEVQGPNFVNRTSVKANSTVVQNLQPGSDYNFTVYAVTNNNVSSRASNVTNVTTLPSIVKTFTVDSKTNQSVILNWTFPDNSYVTTYTYTVEVINGNFNRNISQIKDSFTNVEDLFAGETYYFTIYTVTSNGIRSFKYSFIMVTTMPNEPQNLAGNATGIAEIFIDWTPPGDVHVKLYEYIVAWNNTNLTEDKGQNTTKDTHFNIKSLFPGYLYTITVTSVFRDTSSIHAVKHEQTNPVSTQNFTVLNTTSTTATLQWDNASYSNSKVDGYRVIALQNENKVVYNKTTADWYIVVDSLEPGYIYKFSVESFARNEIAPKKRSLGQMDLTWITYSTPKTTTGETVPEAVKDPTCSKVDGYQIKVEFQCPVGNYSQIRVLVNDKPSDNCSCPESNTISGLQPAQGYKVKIITLGTDKSADTAILKCYTDSTGVIVGSVFGVLLFLLLIGLIVFFVLKKRRSKSNSEHIPISTKRKRFHTITKERFKQNYENNHANSDLGFAEEYQELSSVGTLQPKRAAELPENKGKNRFTNVLPYDHSRVKLTTVNDTATTDYINANFMPGYNSTKEFIASQGPLPNTIADFWRMVWEHHVNTIVMLTNCMENGRVKCERYWPLDYTPCTYGDITVTVTSDTILPEWTTRDFSLKHAKQPGVLYIRHFHFTAWPDHGVPDSTSSIIQFRNLVREHMDQQKSNGPTVVHCSAGVGRTGTLIALDYLIQQMEREHRIGSFAYVEKMRMNRGLMVQTEEQYIFLNKCMLDLIDQPLEENIYENQVPTDLIYENATVVRNFQSENA